MPCGSSCLGDGGCVFALSTNHRLFDEEHDAEKYKQNGKYRRWTGNGAAHYQLSDHFKRKKQANKKSGVTAHVPHEVIEAKRIFKVFRY